jgi:hypothetical protein
MKRMLYCFLDRSAMADRMACDLIALLFSCGSGYSSMKTNVGRSVFLDLATILLNEKVVI